MIDQLLEILVFLKWNNHINLSILSIVWTAVAIANCLFNKEMLSYYAPAQGALSNDAVWRLSVAYIGSKSRRVKLAQK